MMTFAAIFERTGPTEMARLIGFNDPNTVFGWKRTESIPAGHWKAISDAGIATLQELAEAAAIRRIAAKSEAAAA